MKEEVAQTTKEKSGVAGGRGKETLFRVCARNQIELIAIADNKANIIIGINAIIISIIIALFGSNYTFGDQLIVENMSIVLPFSVLLIFSLVSCSLAIMAAKPVIIRTRKGVPKTQSVLFFDLSSKTTLAQYQESMGKLLGSREGIYDQMVIEMYSNGLVLKRKYTFLSVAYVIFLIGFILCVAAALIMSFI